MEMINKSPFYDGIGIYSITDTVTGKIYIGSSRDVQKRFKQHKKSFENGKGNSGLCNAYQQGHKLIFEIVEEIPYGVNEFYIGERELYYINKFDTLNNGFNIHKNPSITEKEILETLSEKNSPRMQEYLINILAKKREKIYKKTQPQKQEKLKLFIEVNKKEEIQALAKSQGLGLIEFIYKAIEEKVERDTLNNSQERRNEIE